ncbi:unnamed protein product [Brachionus calyciflorus]|uniref:Uncharacterized protein n=1 Tax=Brachionus calyciflorus TaxID=104777 RepID=A0A814BFN8_9BILA|nr:unnamed protein product [Brachionus calyciflorus]
MTVDHLIIDDYENLNSSYLTDSLICFINAQNNRVKYLTLGRLAEQKEIGEPFKNFLESLNPINNLTIYINYFYNPYSKAFVDRLLFGDSYRNYYNKLDLHQNVYLINCREPVWGLFGRKRCEQSNRNFSLYNGTCSVDFSNKSDTTQTFGEITKMIETNLENKMESDFSTSEDSIQTTETTSTDTTSIETQYFSTVTSTKTIASSTTSSIKHLESETTTYSSLPKESTTVKQETSTLKKITDASSSKKIEIETTKTSSVTSKSTTATTKITTNSKIAEKMAISSSTQMIISSLLTSSLQLLVLIFVFNFK